MKTKLMNAFASSLGAALALCSASALALDEMAEWNEAVGKLKGRTEVCCAKGSEQIMEAFGRMACPANPSFNLKIRTLDDRTLAEALKEGRAKIAITRYKPAPPAKSFPLAGKGVAVAVSVNNPCEGMTSEQFEKLMSGGLRDWKEIGGPAGFKPFMVVSDDFKSAGSAFAFGKHPRDCQCDECQAARERRGAGDEANRTIKLLPDEPVKLDQCRALYLASLNPAAAALTDLASYDPPKGLKLLKIDGAAPNFESLADASYPLGESFYVATPSNPTPEIEALIKAIVCEHFLKTLGDAGYITTEQSKRQ